MPLSKSVLKRSLKGLCNASDLTSGIIDEDINTPNSSNIVDVTLLLRVDIDLITDILNLNL